MIVYGWRNYYKRKSSFRRDICPGCGRPGYLHSYTATRCAHLYFIPLIPYAQYRILDQCPACEVGRELSLREWKKLRINELRPAMDAVRQDPSNRETAEKALSLVTQLGSKREFAELVGLLAGRFNNDADFLARLGWSFHYFDMPNEGNQALRQSLQIEEKDDVRKLLEFRESEPAAPPPRPPAAIGQLIPLLIAPAIIILLLGFFLFSAVTGNPQRVFLINGLEQPYDAMVNNVPVHLEPHGRNQLSVGYGEIRVEPVDGGLPFEAFTETVETSFFKRGGKGPVIVLNPDRTAVIQWRKAVYADQGASPDIAENQDKFELHAGETSYRFEKVDRAFKPLPEQVQLSSSSTFAYRTGVEQITDAGPAEIISALLSENQTDAAISYARNRLNFVPGDDTTLIILTSIWDPREMAAFLETKLEQRPVLIEWHRHYQQLTGITDPGRDLVAHYRELQEKEPQNRDLIYLHGRLIEDPAESLALLAQATQPPNPSGYAFHAMAYHHMNRGAFEKALELAREARKLEPGKIQFQTLEEEMLYATGQYKELIGRRRSELAENAMDQDAAISLTALFALSDRKSDAQKVLDSYLDALKQQPDFSEELDRQIRAVFDATYAQSLRDLPAFARHSEKVGQGDWLYYAAIINGDFPKADEILKENGSNTSLEQLLLYILAATAGETEFADQRLEEAVALLKEGLEDQQHAADWFVDGAPAPGLGEVYATQEWPAISRLFLTALGVRFPRMQDVYFTAARKMNYNPVFPGLVLDDVLATKLVAPATPPGTSAAPAQP